MFWRRKQNQPRKANDFIGFASYAFDSSNEIRTIEKNENTAVIYGKKAVYFEGHGKFLQWIRHSLENSIGYITVRIPVRK